MTTDGDDQAIISPPAYVVETESLSLADNLVASPITQEMWDYQQGSYPTLRFYLEERRGRPLTSEEFDEFRFLAAVVRLSIERLPRLDELISQVAEDSFTAGELGLPQELGD
jgi:hypothetical protein